MKGWIEVTYINNQKILKTRKDVKRGFLNNFFDPCIEFEQEIILVEKKIRVPILNIIFGDYTISYTTWGVGLSNSIQVKETYDELKAKIEQATKEQSE